MLHSAHILPVTQMNYYVKNVTSRLDTSHSFNNGMDYTWTVFRCAYHLCKLQPYFSISRFLLSFVRNNTIHLGPHNINSCYRCKIVSPLFPEKMQNFSHKWLISYSVFFLLVKKHIRSLCDGVIVYLITWNKVYFPNNKRGTFEIII